jgi:hypothetical protein
LIYKRKCNFVKNYIFFVIYIDKEKYILYNMDEWNEWLSFPVVNKYLSKFKNEVLASMVDLSFAEGKATVAAVNLRQGLEQSNRTVNGNLIIFRLPEKDVADSVRYV